MRCPKCGCNDDKVIDSRAVKDGFGIRRCRECTACAFRFTTLESVSPEELQVIKRNGSRQPFNVSRMRDGIVRACWKRNVSSEEIDRIVGEVSSSLQRDFNSEVESSEIGNRIMTALRQVDEVAFVRFASVYRKFTEAADFLQEIRELKK